MNGEEEISKRGKGIKGDKKKKKRMTQWKSEAER